MKSFLRKAFPPVLIFGAMIGAFTLLAYEALRLSSLSPIDDLTLRGLHAINAFVMAFVLALATIGAGVCWLVLRRIARIESTLNWHINAVNAYSKNLNKNLESIFDKLDDRFKFTLTGFKTADAKFEHLYTHIQNPRHESPKSGDTDPIQKTSHWPWGVHHTEYLGHLDAAARKWWTLYDPSDPTTAPTNDMVADWLMTERRVSKDKARAMASILRADGLPTGPRR